VNGKTFPIRNVNEHARVFVGDAVDVVAAITATSPAIATTPATRGTTLLDLSTGSLLLLMPLAASTATQNVATLTDISLKGKSGLSSPPWTSRQAPPPLTSVP
jgi:hypothetical protein